MLSADHIKNIETEGQGTRDIQQQSPAEEPLLRGIQETIFRMTIIIDPFLWLWKIILWIFSIFFFKEHACIFYHGASLPKFLQMRRFYTMLMRRLFS